ncbi:MAG: hypothetical protein HC935_04635, partial [Pseudanabaena sp. SU_2_4]|nr:hypothetical protein [Pseudanabaena sp. SU_2_4]
IAIRELLIEPDKYFKNENENIRRNGERVWIAWRNKPLLDARGTIDRIAVCGGLIFTDRKLGIKVFDFALAIMPAYSMLRI